MKTLHLYRLHLKVTDTHTNEWLFWGAVASLMNMFHFFEKISRLILYLKMRSYLNRRSAPWVFKKHFWMFPYGSKLLTERGLRSKCYFSGPVIIQGACDMTMVLEGVHICHILKHWLRRLYGYSLSAKRWIENIGQNDLARRNLHGQSRQPYCKGPFYKEDPRDHPASVF